MLSDLPVESTPYSTVLAAASTQPTSTAIATTNQSTPEPEIEFVGQVVCTANEFVNIREEASVDTSIIATFPAGEIADVIAYYSEWVHISYDGIAGYVSREYTVNKSSPSIAVPMGDWAMILVSPTHYLPEGFEVSLADFEDSQVDARILEM